MSAPDASASVLDAVTPERVTQRLLDLCLALAAPRPLGDVLASVLTATTDLLACDRASILLYDAATEQLRFVAATSEETAALARIPVPLDGSLAGTVFRERRAVVSADAATDTRHFRVPGETMNYRPRAIASVPMLVGDECVGVLQSLDPHAGTFADGAVDLLAAVAAQAAIAVDAARDRHAAERARQRLETREHLHHDLLDAAARTLAAPDAAPDAVADVLGTVRRFASAPSQRKTVAWQDALHAGMPTLAPPVLDLCSEPIHVNVDPDRHGAVLQLVLAAAQGDGSRLDVCLDCEEGYAQAEVRGPQLTSPLAALCLAAAALLAERDGATVWAADGAAFVRLPLAEEVPQRST